MRAGADRRDVVSGVEDLAFFIYTLSTESGAEEEHPTVTNVATSARGATEEPAAGKRVWSTA